MGVCISIDDFGTGYSSLSYLQQFPIDSLKIDRSFVNQLEGSDEAREIVKTIVSLAHGLGMDVVAEGIEEIDQQTSLRRIACEAGQGFLYSRPVPVSKIGDLLEQNRLRFTEREDRTRRLARRARSGAAVVLGRSMREFLDTHAALLRVPSLLPCWAF